MVFKYLLLCPTLTEQPDNVRYGYTCPFYGRFAEQNLFVRGYVVLPIHRSKLIDLGESWDGSDSLATEHPVPLT